jgi:hypothetical protein
MDPMFAIIERLSSPEGARLRLALSAWAQQFLPEKFPPVDRFERPGSPDAADHSLSEQDLAALLNTNHFEAPDSPIIPRWIERAGGGGDLWLGPSLFKRVRHDAISQRAVLDEEQRSNWPSWIKNPLIHHHGGNRKKALRDTVRRLNGGQEPFRVRFSVVDGGVAYQIIA